jgi:hypothetical protein
LTVDWGDLDAGGLRRSRRRANLLRAKYRRHSQCAHSHPTSYAFRSDLHWELPSVEKMSSETLYFATRFVNSKWARA